MVLHGLSVEESAEVLALTIITHRNTEKDIEYFRELHNQYLDFIEDEEPSLEGFNAYVVNESNRQQDLIE